MFFFQAEDGIRDLVRSRGLGDVYKRQLHGHAAAEGAAQVAEVHFVEAGGVQQGVEQGVHLSLIHI